MKNMTLSQIAGACGGILYLGDHLLEKEVAGVVVDSRLVQEDYLFIAAAGERVDGHDYIPSAFGKGALAVVCEKAPSSPLGPYILVDNSFAALKEIAKWYRMQLDIKVVGITGSVGKTSTKEFISSVLEQKYQVLKTIGNFNNEIGLPLTILGIRDWHQLAVLEMGISDFGEMHRLSEIAKPDICVITNIGQCHLENLGSRDGILKAKTEIFDFMKEDGSVCVNGDDDKLITIKEVKGRRPLRFGLGLENDIFATDIVTHGLLGSTCKIHVGCDEFEARVPQPGGHMVLNALAATAVGTLFGLSFTEIAAGISSVKALGGRSNVLQNEKYTIIDDCYNANPVSMKAAIDLLHMADTRKVAILGDMFELGNTEKELHKGVGSYAASGRVDVLLCVGALSLDMYEGASSVKQDNQTALEVRHFETREALIEALPDILRQDDTILVKASHGMGFEKVVQALLA
ncbi:MAG TPA: UDP-N-acetylmuramoyl-tripeptide--D-alanyl-D-alanine ligase [Clostridiales bacterium]|nr:UDP-N-acetylmuramoyl-tripeptide--D-alanyl-D-alanine ligase [Clostridiales bacterium]